MRTNREWLDALQGNTQQQAAALEDLRDWIIRTLPYGLSRWLSPQDAHFHDLVEESAQETLLRVLDNLHSFEGRSQFTTWVNKIAVRIALTELRRKRWRDQSLDALRDAPHHAVPQHAMTDRQQTRPENRAVQNSLMQQVQKAIAEELSPRQRQALMLVAFHGVPLDIVAQRMQTNRNALYKMLHDARVKLQRRLTRDGLPPKDILATFEK